MSMSGKDQVYVTGAFISPECLINAEGEGYWVWVVDSFDTSPKFQNGEEICGGLNAVSDTAGGLFKDEEEDEDEQDESAEAL